MTELISLGVTGASGFIGRHLVSHAQKDPRFRLIPFQRDFFDSEEKLAAFASQCTDIVHLAAVSRGSDGDALCRTNVALTEKLACAACSAAAVPAVYLGSTVQIAKDAPYHASKRESYRILKSKLPCAVELLMPNTFGPGSRPFWNSVVSTFCEMAARRRTPDEIRDVELELIGIHDLCEAILNEVADGGPSRSVTIPFAYKVRLPELWKLLCRWKNAKDTMTPYNAFERDLWETFQAYPYERN